MTSTANTRRQRLGSKKNERKEERKMRHNIPTIWTKQTNTPSTARHKFSRFYVGTTSTLYTIRYIHKLYFSQEYFVFSQETLAVFLRIIRSAIFTTTHLMPRRAPLRADSMPVLISCSRRQPTSTLLCDPSANV